MKTMLDNTQPTHDTNLINELLAIIAEELGTDTSELSDDVEFSDLGMDDFLCQIIASRICKKAQLDISPEIFQTGTDVASFKQHMTQVLSKQSNHRSAGVCLFPTPSLPLMVFLRGNAATASKNIFLLPDGSGSAMAYMHIPALGPDVCLYGLNSPFLQSKDKFEGTIDELTPVWVREIQIVQPHGPYILGGWSAGGYFSFEVTKYLQSIGERVAKLVLIDSPCRLIFEALPTQVVRYLSDNNLMGNWGNKGTPEWLVNSFASTIQAVEKYMPTPMTVHAEMHMPQVFLIWASEAIFPGGAAHTGLDLTVKVTRLMIEPRNQFGPTGWDRLFPGEKLAIGKMPGSHFTIVHPPNVSTCECPNLDPKHNRKNILTSSLKVRTLGDLLRDVVQDCKIQTSNHWEIFEISP
jgi:thioesterase domain-containing protein